MSSKGRTRIIGRKFRVLLAVVVAVAGALIGQTAANFNAQTRNPGNTVEVGSLVMSNTKAAGTACFSSSGGVGTNVNNNCDQLFNLTAQKPGDESLQRLTIENEGSIDATALQLYEAACVNADNAETYHGTGNPCSAVQLTVQEYSDAAYTTKSSCRYGGGNGTVCDFSDTAETLAAFQTAYTSGSPLGMGAQNAGVSRYFEIGLKLPASAGNNMQGRSATFDLTWVFTQ